MIVVEGPDGAGKTTLCEYICRQFNLEMGERSEKDRDKIYKTTRRDTWWALHRELMCDSPPLVWDRLGPYSDPIYSMHGIPNRRPVAFTRGEVQLFDNALRYVGVVILCLPPLDVVLDNVSKSHQLAGVPKTIEGVYEDYKLMHGGHFRYDYTKDKPTGVSLLVSSHLRRRKERENLAGDH